MAQVLVSRGLRVHVQGRDDYQRTFIEVDATVLAGKQGTETKQYRERNGRTFKG